MVFVIHWHESAMNLHVFPIPIPPPTSLSTRFLWVFPVHQVRALVSWIQPGLVICFTLDNIHVSRYFNRSPFCMFSIPEMVCAPQLAMTTQVTHRWEPWAAGVHLSWSFLECPTGVPFACLVRFCVMVTLWWEQTRTSILNKWSRASPAKLPWGILCWMQSRATELLSGREWACEWWCRECTPCPAEASRQTAQTHPEHGEWWTWVPGPHLSAQRGVSS